MAWSRAFQKCIIYHFLDKFFFCKHFYYLTGFCDKKFNFCKFANFFEDSKSRAQELSNDVSFVIFGHQTWDLEGRVKLTPPSISWFSSTPARRDRVNIFFPGIRNDNVFIFRKTIVSLWKRRRKIENETIVFKDLKRSPFLYI